MGGPVRGRVCHLFPVFTSSRLCSRSSRWWGPHRDARLSMSVGPPSCQSRRWCNSVWWAGASHLTHPLSRTAAANRWARLPSRWLRPSHNVRPLPPKIIPHTEVSGERFLALRHKWWGWGWGRLGRGSRGWGCWRWGWRGWRCGRCVRGAGRGAVGCGLIGRFGCGIFRLGGGGRCWYGGAPV